MKICMPSNQAQGLDSEAFGHFGSAPVFMIHDTDTNETTAIDNANMHHAHGTCNPLQAIAGHQVDAIIVGGIGRRAIDRLNKGGVKVYFSNAGTLRENIQMIQNGELKEVDSEQACGGHHEDGGCGH